MGKEINLLSEYPKSKRPIKERSEKVKESDRAIARKFDIEYFDKSRLTGYGGYKYIPGFWENTVKKFYNHYNLKKGSKILDAGCAKGFMLYEFKRLFPELDLFGIDISDYAIENCHPEVKDNCITGNVNNIKFDDNFFDLVISINTIHNLPLIDCRMSLKEIQRVSKKNSFITVDAWRNEQEKENMLGWNLTALTYMSTSDWQKEFENCGYEGDYYWFIAE
jgi:ubiquinone/menaquinone biosynthesis C-methylase UbiE